MPLSPQPRRRRTPHATAGNHALANADQNLTEVDTRLTKVDRGCQNLTASTPAPFRRTPNKPEQIRTNLNKPERRQAPRPDRTAPRIAPEHPEKKQTRTPPPPTRNLPRPTVIPAPLSSFLRPSSVIPAQAGTHLANAGQTLPSSTSAPLRRTPNNPEQIRTNPNKPERCQAPRPDRTAPNRPPNTPKKTNPNTAAAHLPSFLRPSRHSCAPSRHSCAGRNPPCQRWPNLPSSTSAPLRRTPNNPEQIRTNPNKPERCQAPPSVIPAPLLVIVVRLFVIPAQAGTHPTPTPFPNSSLPPSRGEVRWGVGGCDRPPPLTFHPHTRAQDPSFAPPPPLAIRAPPRHSCAPCCHPCAPLPSFLRAFSSFLRRQEPGDRQRLVRTSTSRRPAQAASAPSPDVRRPARAAYRGGFLPAQE